MNRQRFVAMECLSGFRKLRRIFLLVALQYCHSFGFGQQTDYDLAVIDYIMTYNEIAVKEMKIYKVPASITLAQGIFESNAGRSRLAVEGNNHFGIKCHKDWQGDTIIEDDETPGECFRKYATAEESFRDHSFFLTQRDRYKSLFSLDIRDYKGWAYGLKVAGYATNPLYAEKLIKAIEKYQLHRFDNPDFIAFGRDSTELKNGTAMSEIMEPPFAEMGKGPEGHLLYLNNGLRLTRALDGDTWNSLSTVFGIPERKLLKYNDLKKGARLAPGQIVYLEKKSRSNSISMHTVQTGETMYTISQLAGIRLKCLYSLNEMTSGQQVKPGQQLILR